MGQEEVRLIRLAETVIKEKYPDMLHWRRTHFHGVTYTLVIEMKSYDISSISDEHIKDLMRIDLEELKNSLQ